MCYVVDVRQALDSRLKSNRSCRTIREPPQPPSLSVASYFSLCTEVCTTSPGRQDFSLKSRMESEISTDLGSPSEHRVRACPGLVP